MYQFETKKVRVKDLKLGDIIYQGVYYYRIWKVEDGMYALQRHILDYVTDNWYWQRATFVLPVGSNQFVMQILDYDI